MLSLSLLSQVVPRLPADFLDISINGPTLSSIKLPVPPRQVPPADLFDTFLHHQRTAFFLQDLFENSCREFPTRPAFRIAGWQHTWTYADFARRAEAVKALLTAGFLGAKAGGEGAVGIGQGEGVRTRRNIYNCSTEVL